jgi:hypothetical protein
MTPPDGAPEDYPCATTVSPQQLDHRKPAPTFHGQPAHGQLARNEFGDIAD